MPKIEVSVTIDSNKMEEFVNTRKTLIERLNRIEGLKVLESNQIDNAYQLNLNFNDSESVTDITHSKWFVFLSGAVKVLGDNAKIVITS